MKGSMPVVQGKEVDVGDLPSYMEAKQTSANTSPPLQQATRSVISNAMFPVILILMHIF